MRMKHNLIIFNDINNREEVLTTLRYTYTDEDFCGFNGEEFTWEDALKEGFKSSQEYVIDKLSKTNLNGLDLVEQFLHEWLDNDGYYGEVSIKSTEFNGGLVVSYAVTEGD